MQNVLLRQGRIRLFVDRVLRVFEQNERHIGVLWHHEQLSLESDLHMSLRNRSAVRSAGQGSSANEGQPERTFFCLFAARKVPFNASTVVQRESSVS